MAPRPRPIRKPTVAPAPVASKGNANVTASAGKDVKPTAKDAMPPPPVPSPPQAILEPEVNALSDCLRNAAVKTAEIYGHYADVQKLGIQRYAPYPPRSLTAALGLEIERYDALVDTIESHILHAIAVLRAELQREEERAKAAEEAVASHTRSKTPSSSPTSTRVPLPPGQAMDISPSTEPVSGILGLGLTDEPGGPTIQTPQISPTGPSNIAARRHSTISLSSLQRPAFPHKLDLSSVRMNADETMFASGLASPVTLAPRSARPTANSELPPDFLAMVHDPSARTVDIDLTLDDPQGVVNPSAVGSSADKPIELDLDMDLDMDMDLFGDAGQEPSADLFTAGEGMKTGNLDALDAFASAGPSDDLFGTMPQQASDQPMKLADTGMAPSPGSILASFEGSAAAQGGADASSGDASSFNLGDLDLSSLPQLDTELEFFNASNDQGGEASSDMELMEQFILGPGPESGMS